MSDLFRTLLLLALAGAAVTVLGSAAAWWSDEERRLRRMLRRALDAPPEMVIIAHGRGLAAGLNVDAGRIAVLWDGGMKGLVYRLDQLVGAELIVDDQVAARAFRDEPRRPLDQVAREAQRILLRLIFDNPRDPDFELPLWPSAEPDRVQRGTAFGALQAARRWVSSVEAVLRKSVGAATTPAQVQARPAQPEPGPGPQSASRADPVSEPLPLFAAAPDDEDEALKDDPPWDAEDDQLPPGRS